MQWGGLGPRDHPLSRLLPQTGPSSDSSQAKVRAAAPADAGAPGAGNPRKPAHSYSANGGCGGSVEVPGRAPCHRPHLLTPANLHLELPRHVLALLLVLLHLLLGLPHLLLEDIQQVVSLHLSHPGVAVSLPAVTALCTWVVCALTSTGRPAVTRLPEHRGRRHRRAGTIPCRTQHPATHLQQSRTGWLAAPSRC